jgi:iron complex outermembrane receptor protein
MCRGAAARLPGRGVMPTGGQAMMDACFRRARGSRAWAGAVLWVPLLVVILSEPGFAELDLSSMDLEDLMQIEVTTASKRARPIGETPAAVTVLTEEDIRRSGATTLAELLRGVPGLHVAQIDATHWSISSRGFSDEFANKLLVMVDGRSIYAPIFSGVLWNEHDLMLEDVQRVEVVRGPGGTLWGANAVNGVINVITKPASETPGGLVSALAGSYESYGGAARYGLEVADSAHLRLYGKFAERDDFRSPVSGSADDDWESVRAGGRFDWSPTERDALTLQGDFFDGRADKFLTGGIPADEQNRGGNLLLRLSHAFSDTQEVSLQGWWDRTDRDQTIIEEKRDTFDVELQHSFEPLARNQLVWGAGFRSTSDDIDGSLALSFQGASRTDQVLSFFVQDELAVVPGQLALTFGTKLEHNDYTGTEFQPSGRILFSPTEKHSFWGAVSRAVRTPSRVEDDVLFLRQTGLTTFEAASGSHDVDSEDLLAYEIGFRSTPHPRVSLDVAAFYNDYDDLRTAELLGTVPGPAPGTTLDLLMLDNRMSGSSNGVEIAGALRLTDAVLLTGTYTYNRLDLDRDSSSTDADGDLIEKRTPRHQFGIRSQVDLPENISFDASFNWVDRLRGAGERVDAYTRLDTRLAWRPIESLELSVVGLNLIEEHQEFPDGLITQASEVPRSVYGSVRWDFE